MCCVIPPASVSTTDASRIASRSVVLPWSTWPMIVTTGGRGARSSSASSNAAGSSSSSAACLIVISRSSSVPMISTSSSESDCVAVRICPRPMRILMSSGIGTPSACERSLTVTPDSTVTGPVGGAAGAAAAAAQAARSRSRGWRPWLRAPPPSMTTRRFRPAGASAGADRAVGPVASVSHQRSSVEASPPQPSSDPASSSATRLAAARRVAARSSPARST